MRETPGHVAVLEDGTFLVVSTRHTHTGTHTDVDEINDIERATVFFSTPWQRDVREALAQYKYRMVPVMVRREVILMGFGS